MLIFHAAPESLLCEQRSQERVQRSGLHVDVEQGELKYQEAMSEDLLGNGQPGRHEHARPVHCMEAQDILAHNVHIGWPAAGLQLLR